MQNTYQYFINGRLVYVPEDELDDFKAQCEETGVEYEEGEVFKATNGTGEVQEFTVPKSQIDIFKATAEQNGGRAEPMTMLTMDDGNRLTLRDEDIRQYAQARATGQQMSRGLLKNAGIPDWYGKSREDREALADRFAEMFGEAAVPGLGASQDNLGDAIVRGGNVIAETVAPAVEAVKGFGEGLVESVTDPLSLYEQTYGDGAIKNALMGAQDFANTVTRGGMEVASKALGGQDTEAGRAIRRAEELVPTNQAEMETGNETADAVLGFANDFSKNTLSTLMKYAAPGVAAVDIAGSVVDNYYDAYARAIQNGASEDKANALAAANAGIGAAEGIWLAQSASSGQTAGAVKEGLKRILGMGGKMGTAEGSRDIVEQGIEGAESPDLVRTAENAAKAAGEGALFEATSMGSHALANANQRAINAEARRTAQERAAEAERENVRAEREASYEASLSAETKADIESRVNEMVKTEVIPSYRQAEEVAQRAAEKLTRTQGESTEAVEQAVMEAAREVAERLQNPSRVETPALERRQAEAEMRENEYLTRRGEEIGEKIATEKPAEERAPSDAEAFAAERQTRQAELDDAFADYDRFLAERQATQKKGGSAKEVETPEAIRDAVRDDAVLNRIDAEYKKAKTDAERNALRDQFKARVDELRGETPVMNGEESAKTDTETQKLTGEMSKNDSEMSDSERSVGALINGTIPFQGKAGLRNRVKSWIRDGRIDEIESWIEDKIKSGEDDYDGVSLENLKTEISKIKSESTPLPKSSDPKAGGRATKDAVDGVDGAKSARPTVVDDFTPKPEEIRAVTDSANAHVDNFTLRMTKKQRATAEKTLNQSVSAFDRTMTMRYFLEHAKNKGLKLSVDFIGGEEKPGATAGVRLPNGELVKLNNTQLSYAKDHLKIETNEPEIAKVRKQIDDAIARGAEADRAKYDKQNKIEIIERPFGEYDLKVENQDFKIKRNKKTGELTLVDSEGNEISTVGGEHDAFDSKQEMVNYLKDKAREFVDGDYDTVDHHARLIAEKKTKAYTEEIGGLKHITDNDKRQFRKIAREYEEAYAELRAEKVTEKEASDIGESFSDIEEGSTAWDASVRFNEAKDALERFHEQAVKYSNLKRGKDGRPIFEFDERADQRRMDPSLRSDAKVIDWAKKHGRTVTDGMVTPDARRAYDEEMTTKTAKQAKRWFPDMKIVTHKYGEDIQRGQDVIDLRDASGRSLGYFSPSTKEVHLLPGANAETVAHEIMWHGTRDYAETQAKNGDVVAQKLLAKMKDVEQHVPDALKNKVTRLYRANGVSSADVLFNEWGAWFTMGKGGKALEDVVATKEGQAWYAKALSTVKDAYKDYLASRGGNRTDLSQIDGMTRDQFVDFLSREFAGGKTLGEIGASKGDGKELSTEETAWQKARRKVYDSVAPVRDLEAAVEKKTGKKIAAEDSVDAALALRPGEHEAVAINQKRQLGEIKDMLKKYGLSSEDLGYYMALKAAPGRDAKIDAKNLAKVHDEIEAKVRGEWGGVKISKDKDGFDAEVEKQLKEATAGYVSTNGSHIKPSEVSRILPEIENGSKAIEYGAARDKINEIQEDTLDTLVKAGLYSKADAEKLRKEEPDYVPFKSEFDPETGEFVGRAYNNLAKKTFYEAKGRKSAAGDILAHILNDNALAHNKAIENDAREKLAKLVEAHPEIGSVSALGNRTLKEAKRGIGGDANVLLFKREGKTYAIELNGERGKAVAAAFTGVNQANVPGWIKTAARGWAATATELSPTFAIRNVTKDNIELAENVIKEMGYAKGAKFIGKYVANQAKSAPALAKYVTTGKIDTSTESGRLLQQFIDDGGMIGGYGSEGYADISRALSADQITKEMKRGTSAAKAAALHTLKSIGYLNKMSEMTSRFNAYRTQLEMGMSGKEAALWSRRTLTDFNRKGDMTGVTNVLRMFSNSTLGATAKAATGLLTTKTGLSLTAGLLANGAAQAIIEHYANADEDEKNRATGKGTGKDVSEYDRKTTLWLNRNAKDGKITKIGSHEGPFQLINYVGNCAARVAMGDMTTKDMANELCLSVAELASAFSGWGSVNFDSNEEGLTGAMKAFVSSAMPSVAQPLFEIGTNTDYAGRKVYTEKGPSDSNPYYTRARKNTPEWAKSAAEAMNTATGGNEYRTGFIDAPAEVVQKLAESFGKNAAKDVITAYETGKAIINGTTDELETRMVPVKRDFMRDTPDSTSRYFEAKKAFGKDDDEYKKRMKTMSYDDRKAILAERPWLKESDRINSIINRIDDLRHFENSEVKSGRGYTKRKDVFPKERIEKFKEERLKLQAKLIEIMGR